MRSSLLHFLLVIGFGLFSRTASAQYAYLECLPGIPHNNTLFMAIDSEARKPIYADMKILFHFQENFLITCGKKMDQSPYQIWYADLSSYLQQAPTSPLSLLGQMTFFTPHSGWNALTNEKLPGATLRFKNWDPKGGIQQSSLLLMSPENEDGYFAFRCNLMPAPETTRFCASNE